MPIQTVCVVGAGNMGSGIAQACAQAGFDVHLVDQDVQIVTRAKERIGKGLDGLVEKGRISAEERSAILDRIRPSGSLQEAAQGIDLAIEAVFESEEAKAPVFKVLDEHAPQHAILATNTSSLSVGRLGAATRRPDRVAGLHFFFPAMINKLVEVVRGEATSDATFSALMAASRRMGKVPIETRDVAGFCVNRFFVPILNESCRLLQEKKANIPTIDAAANRVFGTTMGPFQLMNVTGVPITLHAQRTLRAAFGPFYEPARILVEQVEGKKGDWDLSGPMQEESVEYVEERLFGVAVGIATQLVEEGVASLEDTEKGATIGLRWSRGPFAIANERTTHKALSAASALYMRHGEEFPISQLLRNHGAEDKPFPIRVVTLHRDGHVGRIVVERPAQLNALNMQVLRDLEAALDAFEQADDLRVAVLTGEGKAFVAGADLKELHNAAPGVARRFTEEGQRVLRRIETLEKPVLAAVNGFALGGGLELALACDVIYASRRAELGLPEVSLGIIPGFGGTQRLARRIGPGRARELIFSGRRLGAEEAERLGVVDVVLGDEDFVGAVLRRAHGIAEHAPLAVSYAKRAVREGLDVPLEEGLRVEAELAIATFGTADQAEGFRAFLERRRPSFAGR